MDGKVWMIGLAFSAALAGRAVQAQVTNGRFEDPGGPLAGWFTDGGRHR